jgi:hypothetical protein
MNIDIYISGYGFRNPDLHSHSSQKNALVGCKWTPIKKFYIKFITAFLTQLI